MANLEDLMGFLTLDSPRLDLKSTALEYVVGLTASKDGQQLIRTNQRLISLLLNLTKESQPLIARDAHLALVNLSGVDNIVEVLLGLDVISDFLKRVVDPKWIHADQVCMILSNLTRSEKGSEDFVKVITHHGVETDVGSCPTLYQLVDIFDRVGYNKKADFHYLATIFSNITQMPAARQLFLDRSKCIIPRLLPYTQFEGSIVRKGGVVGLLRNLCFEVGKDYLV